MAPSWSGVWLEAVREDLMGLTSGYNFWFLAGEAAKLREMTVTFALEGLLLKGQ